jgi:PAS domain S-box-containing protein
LATKRGRLVRHPHHRRSDDRNIRDRLQDAESTLEAIRSGQVDALVVAGPKGDRALTLEGARHPYFVLLNAMTDGAALLEPNGAILFGNRALGAIAGMSRRIPAGSKLQHFVARADRPRFDAFLREGAKRRVAQEFGLARGSRRATPVTIALSVLPRGNGAVLMATIADLSSRRAAEVTRLRLMTRLISAEDDERRRIARELHDETGQSLTALLVGLRAIEEQAITLDVQAAAQRLRSVAAQTVDDVGRLARGLHPSVLDDMGLAAAARRYVADFVKSFGVRVTLRFERSVSNDVPPLAQTTMYRILQESLTNVARHARARVVKVALKHRGAVLQLVVEDDGVGFDSRATLKTTTGLGLHGMRERVAMLGGSVEIESTPGQGVVLRAHVPTATIAHRQQRSVARPRSKRAG